MASAGRTSGVAFLLMLALAPLPAAAQEDAGDGVSEEEMLASEARAAMTNCQCLQCFPSAIRYNDAMAEGFAETVRAVPAILQYWDDNPAVHADYADRAGYLEQAYRDAEEVLTALASETSPRPSDCEEAGDGAAIMRTSLGAGCGISQREEARMRMPCDDLYLGVLAHELVHRQFCSDNAPEPIYTDDIARRAQTEADAYRTEADVLRILYLRRSRDCQAPTTRVRFTDLPDALDFLNRAVNYERDNPLMSAPAGSR